MVLKFISIILKRLMVLDISDGFLLGSRLSQSLCELREPEIKACEAALIALNQGSMSTIEQKPPDAAHNRHYCQKTLQILRRDA